MRTKKILKLFTNPIWAVSVFISRHPQIIKNDEKFIKWDFYKNLHRWPNLKAPKTFNEKLNWLKIHDQHSEYTQLVDKCLVKPYIESIIGKEHVIPTIGVWDKFEDINFNELPNKFVLKCTHDSGGIVICKDKKNLNIKQAQKKIKNSLKTNFYLKHREYPYKDVKPKIIAEELLESKNSERLDDYKFMCFNGVCQLIFVCSNRNEFDVNVDFYDTNWRHLPFKRHHENSNTRIPKPEQLEKMIDMAEKIAKNIKAPFVRIDFYNINSKIYFGEITFFPGAGLEEFEPEEWDYKIGELITLPTN